MRKHQLGVTLLEVLLALAIGAAVILMGIKQYQQYQTQQYMAQLQFNVDELFQGMSLYYQANCQGLNPATATVAKDIQTDLEAPGFLRTQWQPFNPLINNSSTNNYIVQFNVSGGAATTPRYISACWNFTGQQADLQCTTPEQSQASVYIWRVQVAIEFPSTTDMDAMKSLLLADCISDLSGNIVTPCNSSAGTGYYLVWERLPSFATANSSSGLWPSIQVLQGFNLQYTHDQLYEFQNPSYGSSQNYMCGG